MTKFDLIMAKTKPETPETLPEFGSEVLKILADVAATVRAQAADLLTVEQVAILTNISVRMIYEMVATDEFPRPIKRGTSSRWKRSDITTWVDSLQQK